MPASTSLIARRGPFIGLRRSLARLIGASAAVIVALQSAGPASAQTGDAGQRRFAQDYVAALRSGDKARLAAFLHPSSRACMTGEARPFFDLVLDQQIRTGGEITAAYEIQHFKPVAGPAETMGLPPEAFAYPVQPTRLMQLNAHGKDGRLFILLAYLAPAQGGWAVVTPCPNAEGLKMIAQRARSNGGR